METWMNEIYHRTKEPTLEMFTQWTSAYLKEIHPSMIFSLIVLVIGVLVLYCVLMRNPMKAVLLLGSILTVSFCVYYVVIFQPSYPKEQVVHALNSAEAVQFLEDRERQTVEIRGLIIEEVDFTEVSRDEVSIIGLVDTERLRKVTFNIKADKQTTQYTGYAYLEEAPEGTRRSYVEFYTMDESKILPQILTEKFFDIKMYNMVIYQR